MAQIRVGLIWIIEDCVTKKLQRDLAGIDIEEELVCVKALSLFPLLIKYIIFVCTYNYKHQKVMY